MNEGDSHRALMAISAAAEAIAYEHTRPCVVFKALLQKGDYTGTFKACLFANQDPQGYCLFVGPDADTPAKAMLAFDTAWMEQRSDG